MVVNVKVVHNFHLLLTCRFSCVVNIFFSYDFFYGEGGGGGEADRGDTLKRTGQKEEAASLRYETDTKVTRVIAEETEQSLLDRCKENNHLLTVAHTMTAAQLHVAQIASGVKVQNLCIAYRRVIRKCVYS